MKRLVHTASQAAAGRRGEEALGSAAAPERMVSEAQDVLRLLTSAQCSYLIWSSNILRHYRPHL